MAFSCTVVSTTTTTRSNSPTLTDFMAAAASNVDYRDCSTLASPSTRRKRLI